MKFFYLTEISQCLIVCAKTSQRTFESCTATDENKISFYFYTKKKQTKTNILNDKRDAFNHKYRFFFCHLFKYFQPHSQFNHFNFQGVDYVSGKGREKYKKKNKKNK